ncbi:hypothetical protein FOXYSP1_19491 [Fusarium oxysporum f. sp. phaseoli]
MVRLTYIFMSSRASLRVHSTGTMKQNLTKLYEIGLRVGIVVQPVRRYDVNKRIRRWGLTDDQHQMIEQAYSKLLSNEVTAQELARFQVEYRKQHGSFSCPNDKVWICLERRDRSGWHKTAAMNNLEDYNRLVESLEPKKGWRARVLSMCFN